MAGLFKNKFQKQSSPKMVKSNSTKLFQPKISYVVRKMNEKELSSDLISKEINEYLSSPEKYFSPNSKVTIGKKIKLKDMNKIGIEPVVVPKKMTIINKKMSIFKKFFNSFLNNNEKISNLRSSISSSHFNMKDKQQIINDKYEIIDNEQLKKIFNKYKTVKNSFNSNDNEKNNFIQIKDNNSISINQSNQNKNLNENKTKKKEIPFDLSQSLFFQNNKLKERQTLDNKVKNISKHLSKILKKSEKDLLLNKIDNYNFKNELLKDIEFNKPVDEKYGKFKWNISLRRPKQFEGMRNSYINLTRDENPFWGIVIEKYPKIKELKIKPGSVSENRVFFEKFKKTYSPKINLADYKNIENLDNLYIKGENLYNIEYNREIKDNKNKKILYKAFVDKGGKVIMKNEINNIFGDMTFFENYSNNNLLSTRYTNSNMSNSNNNNNTAYNTFTSKLALHMKNCSKSSMNFKNLPNSFSFNEDVKKKRLSLKIPVWVCFK